MRVEITDTLVNTFVKNCKCQKYLFEDIVKTLFKSFDYYIRYNDSAERLIKLLSYSEAEYIAAALAMQTKLVENNYNLLIKNLLKNNYDFSSEHCNKANPIIDSIKEYNFFGGYIIAHVKYNRIIFYENEDFTGESRYYYDANHVYSKVETEVSEEDILIQYEY